MIVTLGNIAITLGLICGMFLTVIGESSLWMTVRQAA